MEDVRVSVSVILTSKNIKKSPHQEHDQYAIMYTRSHIEVDLRLYSVVKPTTLYNR